MSSFDDTNLTDRADRQPRLRTGKIARHQRLPRDRPLYYKDWEIPAGVRIP